MFYTTFLCILLSLLIFKPVLSQSTPSQFTEISSCTTSPIDKNQFMSSLTQNYTDGEISKLIKFYFPAEELDLGEGVLTADWGKIKSSTKNHYPMYIASVGIPLLLAIIFLILPPILLCTKCCQCCQCCDDSKSNNKFSACCPTILMILLLIAVIVLSCLIIVRNREFQNDYREFKCSISIVIDDVSNGGQYNNVEFLGVNGVSKAWNEFTNSLGQINDTIQNSLIEGSTPVTTHNQHISTLYDLGSKIPSESTQSLALSYPTPLLSLTPTSSIPSNLNQLLGTYTINNTLVYNLTQRILNTNETITKLSIASTNISNVLENMSNEEANVNKKISSTNYEIKELQFNIDSAFDIFEQGVEKFYVLGSYIVLGITIFLSLLIIFTLICMTLCNKINCKNTLIALCFLFWIIGIVHFALALFFTVSNPAVLYSCEYGFNLLESEEVFEEKISKIIDDNDVLDIISKCLPNSKTPEPLVVQILPESLQSKLQSINSHISNPKLNPMPPLQTLQTSYSNLLSLLSKYKTSSITDISDAAALSEILSTTKTTECMPDSWLPSLTQSPVLFTCNLTNTNTSNQANNITCLNEQSFISRSEGCVGCIDTYLILEPYTQYNEVLTDMKNRYTNCSGNNSQNIVENITNLWYNYHLLKKDNIGSVEQRTERLEFNLNQITQININQIEPAYQNLTHWQNTQSLLNNNNLNNCTIIGVNLSKSLNSLCSQAIPYAYYLRIFYTTIAIAILFFTCLALMVWARATKVKAKGASYSGQEMKEIPETERRGGSEEQMGRNWGKGGYF